MLSLQVRWHSVQWIGWRVGGLQAHSFKLAWLSVDSRPIRNESLSIQVLSLSSPPFRPGVRLGSGLPLSTTSCPRGSKKLPHPTHTKNHCTHLDAVTWRFILLRTLQSRPPIRRRNCPEDCRFFLPFFRTSKRFVSRTALPL